MPRPVITHSQLLAVLMVVFASTPAGRAAEPAPVPREKPNVLLIVADDLGWGDLGLNGNPSIETPRLDALAGSGLLLERFYVCPNCAPTRASLLTGRYHYRTGVASVSRGEETMHSHEITLAEALRQGGYATGCFGKWHNGSNWPQNPNGQGFDEFVGICQGHWNRYFDAELEHNGEPLKTEGWITDVLTDQAIAFMDRESRAGRPFFCYLPYNTPHGPFQAPDALFEKYRSRDLDPETAAVYAMVESIDGNVGRILDWLDDRKLRERTIVWFLSDNGPALSSREKSPRYNGHLRGAKGSVHEGGVRVPSFVSWPGTIPAGSRFRRLTAHIDVWPTLVDLCGVGPVETPGIDGINLVPALTSGGKPERWPNRILFTSWTPPDYDVGNASVAVRTDRWLAVRDPRWRRGKVSETHSGWELYDLNADPHEWTDLSDDYPFLLSDMRADFSRWMDETTDNGLGPIPTEIGHPEWPVVILRAQDAAIPEEWKLKRGNHSSLSGWTDPEHDSRWPVEVVGEGGIFAVEIEYALPLEAVPCQMSLSLGDRQLAFVLDEPFESEVRENADRVPRNESPEMTWKRAEVGEIRLGPGEGELVLKPLALRGEAIRLLRLRLRRIGN